MDAESVSGLYHEEELIKVVSVTPAETVSPNCSTNLTREMH